MTNPCTYIDGIASSQAIDTAGEIVDIAGLDCSSLLGAAFNWEHKSDVPAQIVGKVLDFKKIYTVEDCDTDRQKHYWSKIQMPFLYVMGRLFDDKKDSSKEVAALMLDDAQNPHEPPMLGFSIEGAKIHKEGMRITRSIARKVTITNLPANKTCSAETLPSKKKAKNSLENIFKGELTLFSPGDKYLEFLTKKEDSMEKDGAFIGDSLAMGELAKSAAAGWSHSGGGNFSHPEHGTVSVIKQPTGEFHVKHNGALAGVGGKKGIFGSAADAGQHAGQYMKAVSQKTVMAPMMHNHSSPNMLGKSAPSYKMSGDTHVFSKLPKEHQGPVHTVSWSHPKTKSVNKYHFPTPEAAKTHADHLNGKGIKATVSSGELTKSLEAGSSMAAPSQLTQGAALGKESLDGKMHKAGFGGGMAGGGVMISEGSTGAPNPTKPRKGPIASVGTSMTTTLGKKEKSEWLKRAEHAYESWEKREQFEDFMKKKMPNLTKGEIKAIGQTLALKKAVQAETKLSKMYASYFDKSSDIMMASEKKK